MTLLAYPCIGGPLAGEYATTSDFTGASRFLGREKEEDGMYAHLAGEYLPYNLGSAIPLVARRGPSGKRIGQFPPTMVFVHQSMLKPLKRASER